MIGEEDWESSFLAREQILMWQVDWTKLKGIEDEIFIVVNLQGE